MISWSVQRRIRHLHSEVSGPWSCLVRLANILLKAGIYIENVLKNDHRKGKFVHDILVITVFTNKKIYSPILTGIFSNSRRF
jgi:hypothetical protein